MKKLPKDSTLALPQFYSRFSDIAIQRYRRNEEEFKDILHQRAAQVSVPPMKVSDSEEPLTSRRAPRQAS